MSEHVDHQISVGQPIMSFIAHKAGIWYLVWEAIDWNKSFLVGAMTNTSLIDVRVLYRVLYSFVYTVDLFFIFKIN